MTRLPCFVQSLPRTMMAVSCGRGKVLSTHDLCTCAEGGSVPSIDSIVAEIGEERAKRMLPDIIGRRKFENVLQGYRSPCHYCGSDKDLVYFEFALMRVESSKVEVKPTLMTAAV